MKIRDDSLNGVKAEISKQLPESGLRMFEIVVMPESTQPARWKTRLIGVDLPRVKVEHRWLPFNLVDA